MPVRFIIGRAGSGKTHTIHEAIVERLQRDPLGAKIIHLVPRQVTFTAERRLAMDDRLSGYVGARIVSIDQLIQTALLETCVAPAAPLDGRGREIVLAHLLRENRKDLVYFAKSATQPTLAGEIDAAFLEFERAGRDPVEIDTVLAELDTKSSEQNALANKLRDLKLLYHKMRTFLEARQVHVSDRIEAARKALESWKPLQGAQVFIDEHHDFSALEREAIISIARVCQSLDIAMCFDPASRVLSHPDENLSEMSTFNRVERAYRKLYIALRADNQTIQPPSLLKVLYRYQKPELAVVEHDVAPRKLVKPDAIRFIETEDGRAEVAAAAREVKRLASLGMRYREICVLMRSSEDYADLIDAGFREHQIPYFIDRRRSASHHPLVRAIAAVGQVVLTRFETNSVIALAKTGFARVSPELADLLEDYALQHRLTPRAWTGDEPWGFRRRKGEEDELVSEFPLADLKRANDARLLIRDSLGPLADPAWSRDALSVRQRTADLFGVLQRFHARVILMDHIKRAEQAGQLALRDEHIQVWENLVELFEQMTELIGDEPMKAADYFGTLNTALSGFDLAITPPMIDQVLIGSVDRTRTRDMRGCILLGMNDGQFPQRPAEPSVLNNDDRDLLNSHQVEVEPGTERKLLDERFLGYLALTRASESLTLIRTTTDSAGNPAGESPFWLQAKRLFHKDDVVIQKTTAPIDRVATRTQAVAELLRWARKSPKPMTGDALVELYRWFVLDPHPESASLRKWVWPALTSENRAVLSPDLAKRIFPSPLVGSVSRLELFAACPFKHFARYGLELEDRPDLDVTAIDLGNVYHQVLDRIVRKKIDQKRNFIEPGQFTAAEIHDLSQEVGEELRNQVMLSSARNEYLLGRIELTLNWILRTQQAVARSGAFRPLITELSFGGSKDVAKVPDIPTPGGNVLKLKGRIDRIDVSPQASAFTVIDYKLSGKSLQYGHIYHGLVLQLLSYLLVLKHSGANIFPSPMEPAAAFYMTLRRGLRASEEDNPDLEPTPDDRAFDLTEQPTGIISRPFAKALDTNLESARASDVFNIKINLNGALAATGNDALEPEDFAALLTFVRKKLAELADFIISGDIDVKPYRIGKLTPCSGCEFNRFCRFEPGPGAYRNLESLNRQKVLDLLRQENA